MVDTWTLITNSTQLLIPKIQNPEEFSFLLLFMLVGGFLSLTLCYVLTKQDKKWMELEIFSKAGVSMIVGAMSYLVIHMAIFLWGILKLVFTQKGIGEIKLNYMGLIAMIIYAYLVIMLANRLKKKSRRNIDTFRVLEFFQVSASLATSFYFLSSAVLFGNLACLLKNFTPRWIPLVLGSGSLILFYSAYNFSYKVIEFFMGKKLPYTSHWLSKKIFGVKKQWLFLLGLH